MMSYGLRKAKLHRDKDEPRKEAEAGALAIVDYWAGKGYDVKGLGRTQTERKHVE